MGVKLKNIPVNVKIVYMKGYLTAIEEICQKLTAQIFKIQEKIEQLEGDQEGA